MAICEARLCTRGGCCPAALLLGSIPISAIGCGPVKCTDVTSPICPGIPVPISVSVPLSVPGVVCVLFSVSVSVPFPLPLTVSVPVSSVLPLPVCLPGAVFAVVTPVGVSVSAPAACSGRFAIPCTVSAGAPAPFCLSTRVSWHSARRTALPLTYLAISVLTSVSVPFPASFPFPAAVPTWLRSSGPCHHTFC